MSSFWQQSREVLDRVVRGSRHSVGAIGKSLDRQAAMQRLAARIRGLNRERSELVRTIGKKVYSLHTRGKVRNRDVLSDCLRIDETGQEIEALQQQIEELRRQGAASEELVVEIEDETPVTEEAEEEEAATEPPEEEEGATEPPEEQTPQPEGEAECSEPDGEEPRGDQEW